MRAARLLAAASLVLAVASPASAEAPARLTGRLGATLEVFRADYGFPGATAALALPNGRLVTAAAGFADIEAGREMTPGARMLAASIGKTFVAATVLALESQGRLSQADPLADHLGDRPWFGDLSNGDAITLGQLLRHTSGLPDHPHLPAFQQAAAARIAAGAPAFGPEELVGFVLDREPLFAPGDGWAYSDTGYILLGLVIEQVTGRAYHDEVRERFLAPLGLDDTLPSDGPDIPGLAVGYTVPGNPFGLPERTADAGGRLVWDPGVEWTGGGLASTSADLARWGQALFTGGAMAAPYLDRLLDAVPVAEDAPEIRYGAGVAIYADTPRGPVWGHGGWIPAYVSSLRHYAEPGVTVAFQINTDAGVVDDSTDLVPALEAALADLAIGASAGTGP
ncbi:class A beta-lactamase-related serine hydrolase [Rhodovulum sp. 12E13]|uniref:serine hydrolase domain-containing protein n=1 Tax=Rhodovulum sp. 12E13 TaxID=2203891 RepID=UPI000E1AE44C|nr:serine hydrolase domain-containing protein [Rhodovulum sp. 12E13]RDC69691.1 class A beta-lactamase-related serine hydrolase [Rhodovulum sp. 12E13]